MKTHTIAVLVCLLTTTLSASVGPSISIGERARGSAVVVLATVTDVQSRFGTTAFGDQVILSDLRLDVGETLKGQSNQNLTVTIEGGEVGELTLRVSDMPVMRSGERAVFFLDRAGNGHVLHGRGSGVLKVDEADRVRGTDLTVDDVRRSVRAVSR
jgi:hypothetical protein